jgi:hypothetical protein
MSWFEDRKEQKNIEQACPDDRIGRGSRNEEGRILNVSMINYQCSISMIIPAPYSARQ